MSQNPPYDMRNFHANSDGDEALQRPRRPNPDTEARLLQGNQAPQTQSLNPMRNYKLSVNAPEFVPRFGGPGNQTAPNYPPPDSLLLSPGAAEFVPRTDLSPVQCSVAPTMGVGRPLQLQGDVLLDSFNQMNMGPGMNQYPGGGGANPQYLVGGGGGNNRYGGGGGGGGGHNNQYPPPPAHHNNRFPPKASGQYPGGGGGGGGGGGDQFPPGMEHMDPLTRYLLTEFSNAMMTLTTLPANIREYLHPLCGKLRKANTPEILEKVIEILYGQSIYEPNFRYTGARVVHYLCSELKNHPIFGQFKVEFLKKCQHHYLQRENLLKSGADGLSTLCGLTLFMGELFLNVTADGSGQVERLEFLPSALTDLVSTLLSLPSDVTVKTACQLLKLAGGLTEEALAQKEAHEIENFNSIFATLTALQSNARLSQNNKLLMQSVLKLRASNWGRPDSRPPASRDSQPASSVTSPEFEPAEPVFYNQYGKTITREEAGYAREEEEEEALDEFFELTEEEERDFLEWQEEASTHEQRLQPAPVRPGPPGATNNYADSQYQQWSTNDASSYNYGQNYSNYNSYPNYPAYPDEEGGLTMDDEAEQAYEEFLSSQR